MNHKYRHINAKKNLAANQEKNQQIEFPKTLTTSLGQRGYNVLKTELTDTQQDALKKLLLVKPVIMGNVFCGGGGKEPSFPIYRESGKKIYMPRYFGETHFGAAKSIALHPGDDIAVEFSGTLRENQKPVVETYINYLDTREEGGGLLELPCAYGKCLGRNTKILMYDGSIKFVQDINVGDVIMGDDSMPRNILSLARGRETMYKIKSPTGENYIVNESHILSLKYKNPHKQYAVRFNKRKYKDIVKDVSLMNYLDMKSKNPYMYKRLMGYRVPIVFEQKTVEIDPYLFGYWLGTTRFSEDTIFEEYINITRLIYYQFITKNDNMKFVYNENGDSDNDSNNDKKTYAAIHQKRLWDTFLEKYDIINKKSIPHHYKCNSRSMQLSLLAGIIDANGYCDGPNKTYVLLFSEKYKLIDDILFLVRSLGFSGTKQKIKLNYCDVADIDDNDKEHYVDKTHYYIHIKGNNLHEIPVKQLVNCFVNNKKTPSFPTDLKYKIVVEKLEEDDYYGFQIDGNNRFVLGDFTVTHNTTISLNIISRLKKKTLVIVHKEFLLNQWVERINQFLPSARVGRIQGTVLDIENKDIVIGMLQSLSMKEYSESTFESFGLTIIDEAHHISSEVFSRALFKIVTKYMLGLSATMERKDGTTYVFKMFLGDVVYKGSRDEEHDVCVRAIKYEVDDAEFNETEVDFRGNPKFSTMITKLCSYNRRSDFIVRVLRDLIQEQPSKQIMVLSHNRSLLTYIYDAVVHYNFATIGYYVGGMKQTALQDTESKLIVLATYAMAAEALDIKTLSTLVMVTPKTDIVQSVGRILRVKHERPIVVDIVDSHDIFQNQWVQRRRYYKKCNYRIRHIGSKTYTNMMIDWETDITWKRVFEPKKTANTTCSNNTATIENTASDEDDDDIDESIKKPAGKCLINIGGLNL
uniref:Helicase ATP-binding domain-containing protein n=1 Tax=viral metagenome TaxID=1070528 RepID=A0A6C0DS77_9ZZZZ